MPKNFEFIREWLRVRCVTISIQIFIRAIKLWRILEKFLAIRRLVVCPKKSKNSKPMGLLLRMARLVKILLFKVFFLSFIFYRSDRAGRVFIFVHFPSYGRYFTFFLEKEKYFHFFKNGNLFICVFLFLVLGLVLFSFPDFSQDFCAERAGMLDW